MANPNSNPVLAEVATDELIAEIKRRSLACVITAVKIGGTNKDEWQCAIKGSPIMLGTVCAFQALKIEDALKGVKS